MCGEVITNAKTKRLSFKSKSITSYYWEENQESLKPYFKNKYSFAGFVRRYGFKPIIKFEGLDLFLAKQRRKD